MRFRVLLAVLPGLALILGLTSVPALAATPATVSGVVKTPGGKPAAGATVELLREPPGTDDFFPVKTVTTDTKGRYNLKGITARSGRYTVQVTPRSGYQRGPDIAKSKRFTLKGGQTATQNVTLLASGIIAGKASTETTVRVRGKSIAEYASTATASDGTYRLRQLPAGTYTLTFEDRDGRAECYFDKKWKLPRTEDITDGCTTSTVVTVKAGRTTQLKNQDLGGGTATFTTRLVDDTGAPIVGATVVLDARPAYYEDDNIELATGRTDADGRIVFTDVALRGQTYFLRASTSDGSLAEEPSTGEFEVTDGQTVFKKLVGTRAGTITGSVSRGPGVDAVYASLLTTGGDQEASVGVEADGAFDLTQVRPGTYLLGFQFEAPSNQIACYLNQTPTANDLSTGCLKATRITVKAGAKTTLQQQTVAAP